MTRNIIRFALDGALFGFLLFAGVWLIASLTTPAPVEAIGEQAFSIMRIGLLGAATGLISGLSLYALYRIYHTLVREQDHV